MWLLSSGTTKANTLPKTRCISGLPQSPSTLLWPQTWLSPIKGLLGNMASFLSFTVSSGVAWCSCCSFHWSSQGQSTQSASLYLPQRRAMLLPVSFLEMHRGDARWDCNLFQPSTNTFYIFLHCVHILYTHLQSFTHTHAQTDVHTHTYIPTYFRICKSMCTYVIRLHILVCCTWVCTVIRTKFLLERPCFAHLLPVFLNLPNSARLPLNLF